MRKINLSFIAFILSLFIRFSSQELVDYDGSTSIKIGSGTDGIRYPVKSCNTNICTLEMTINIEATFEIQGETDLVVIFGTDDKYFSFCIAYDGYIGANLIGGGIIITPLPNQNLWDSSTSLVCFFTLKLNILSHTTFAGVRLSWFHTY